MFSILGPYILFWGGLTTILSKEYFVPWVDTPEHLVFLGLFVYFSKTMAPKVAAMLDKEAAAQDDAYNAELAESTKSKRSRPFFYLIRSLSASPNWPLVFATL